MFKKLWEFLKRFIIINNNQDKNMDLTSVAVIFLIAFVLFGKLKGGKSGGKDKGKDDKGIEIVDQMKENDGAFILR
ncbi:MAG: hypothetical protein EXS49_01035, partial [Candidatus Pacebacteria bacterium]|nr:hypothetical protein [Candidatus Paceibacterota bacterium]